LASHSKFVVVIGIGGSYLGSKAVIDALSNPFSAFLPGRTHPVVIFAGHNMCEEYHKDLLEFLSKVDYSVIVISKSGTTTEPAIAYRLIKAQMEIRYGKEEASLRTVAITDATKGDLKEMADKEKITQFIIPDDVGGRFSVLTPVGLLPIAAAGFNIDQLMKGANDMRNLLVSTNHPDQNPAIIYAAIRNALLRQGKTIELLVNYTPRLQNLIEWWKQLYGESEGKEGKGIFPAGANFTTDLHSMGQYIQDGQRMLFETVISVEQEDPSSTNPQDAHLTIPDPEMKKENAEDLFGGKTMAKINLVAEEATCEAHVEGGVPNIRIHFHPINEYNLGKLIYFFEFACALSGYTLDVNPFDQPGVEAYKKKMFKRLG
jgi:glucose-6-phosphate isomerase